MSIYLIRHTTPAAAKDICYGNTDVDVSTDFDREFLGLLNVVSKYKIKKIYTSPLQRSSKLAVKLAATLNIELKKDDRLKELNYGLWEMEKWGSIHPTELNIWMVNFVNLKTPKGESYLQMHKRVSDFLNTNDLRNSLIVSHAGVMRSILSSLMNTPLGEAYKKYNFNYNEVIEVDLMKRTYQLLENTLKYKNRSL